VELIVGRTAIAEKKVPTTEFSVPPLITAY
jgi:hypothetical protein